MIQLYINGKPDLSRFDKIEWHDPELKKKARKLLKQAIQSHMADLKRKRDKEREEKLKRIKP